MTHPTQSPSKIGCLLVAWLSVAPAACGAQAGDAASSAVALSTFSKARVAQEAPVEVRRLLAGNVGWSFETASPSPDGRYLTDIAWGVDAGSSFIDLETGEETQIPNQDHTGFADTGSAFSPDGSRVAYAYLGSTGYEVRSIGVNGADPRVHLRYSSADGDDFAEVADWSKDGQYLLINGYPAEGQAHIATINVATNEYRILKTVDMRGPGSSFFSPDGRFVAYGLRSHPSSRERDIFLVSRDGSQGTTLIRTPDHERLLGWLPDGSGILFHRSADDSWAIWKLPMRDGRPAGPPELVKDDVLNMTGFGFSDDAYFYGVTVSRRGIHTASFDLDTGRALEALKPVSDTPGLFTSFATWSPDGTRIVYFATQPGRNNESQPSRIIVQSSTGEILQDLPLALSRPTPPGWTAHGLVVLTRRSNDIGPAGYYLVSLETGEATYLRESPGDRDDSRQAVTVSEDGSSFFISDSPSGAIIEYDLATRSERVLVEGDGHILDRFPGFPDAWIGGVTVSPDEDKVLYHVPMGAWPWDASSPDGGMAVVILSRSTGESRVIRGFNYLWDSAWSSDGRYVVSQGWLEGQEGRQLFRISAEDGSVIVLAEGSERFRQPRVSPDGRHILVVAGERRQEIWRMTFNSER